MAVTKTKAPTSKKIVRKTTSKAKSIKKPVASKKPEKEKSSSKPGIRDVKYLYPEDCVTSLDKKKFRTSTRNKLRQFEKKIGNASSATEGKKLKAEFNRFKKSHYTDPKNAGIGNVG